MDTEFQDGLPREFGMTSSVVHLFLAQMGHGLRSSVVHPALHHHPPQWTHKLCDLPDLINTCDHIYTGMKFLYVIPCEK